MKMIIASNNAHKVEELRALLGAQLELVTLKEAGIEEELPETSGTIPGNAKQKAARVFELTGMPCFADDSGLEIESLGGRPGVDSAYYAGPERDSDKNMDRVLLELEGSQNRIGRFITVIAFTDGNLMHEFLGEVKGTIAKNKSGIGGFGYDPIFIPEGYNTSFAELDPQVKNQISHRAMAANQFADFLKQVTS